MSIGSTGLYESHAPAHILTQSDFSGATFCLNIKDAIAESGTTQIFILEGTPVINEWKMTQPLKVALANGRQGNIYIDGFPTVLMGHIIPNLSIASLFGIRALTDAGCKVTFDRERCTVQYNSNIFLSGGKIWLQVYGPSLWVQMA